MSSKENVLEKKEKKSALSKAGIYICLVALVVVFAILCSMKGVNYLSANNISNIFVQTSVIGIVAIGTSMIILTGGIDLSCGSMLAFNGIFCAILITKGGLPVPVALIITIVLSCVVGYLTGIGISVGKLPPFIMTLGVMNMAEGAALAMNGGQPVSGLPGGLNAFAKASLFGIPSFIFVLIGLYALMIFVMHRTKYGYHVYALGGNPQAARLSGINTKKLEISVYTLGGLFTGIASILLLARLSYAAPTSGIGYEMDAIGSCVIGGISLSGGQGKMFNTLIGALILTIIKNGLQMLDISSYYQTIVTGAIIVFAVFIDKAEARKAE
jgi:ribose transport system permease protein